MDDYDSLMRGIARQAVKIGAAWPFFGIRGFSDFEINAIETSFGYKLPECYRAFPAGDGAWRETCSWTQR